MSASHNRSQIDNEVHSQRYGVEHSSFGRKHLFFAVNQLCAAEGDSSGV